MSRLLSAAALLCLVSICGTQPAFARHHQSGGSGKAATAAHGDSVPERAAKHRSSRRIHQRPALANGAPSKSAGYFTGGLVERARAYIGRTGPSLGLPARLWCSDFMNMVTGGGTGSRLAKSWLSKPRVSPQVGAVVVVGRRGGGHVGIVSGFTAKGDPIVVSGNFRRLVGEGVVARARVIAYVSP